MMGGMGSIMMGGMGSPQAQAMHMAQVQQQRARQGQGAPSMMMGQQPGGAMRPAAKLMSNGSMQNPAATGPGFGGLPMPKLGGPSTTYVGESMPHQPAYAWTQTWEPSG